MIRRPLDARFGPAVAAGIKITTIRDKPWPLGVPIQLYHWTGRPYASKQQPASVVTVLATTPIRIQRWPSGAIGFYLPDDWENAGRSLWNTEGFHSVEEMEVWFKRLVKPGQSIEKHLMHFTVTPRQGPDG